MRHLFSDEVRRNPYPLYDRIRAESPLLHDPESDLWMVFDHDGVKRVLSDHETFSSRHGPADWLVFLDSPRHTKLRAIITRAFTPRVIGSLEPRIRELSRQLLDRTIERGEMDLASDFSIPLPMMVIAEMLGIPAGDLPSFQRWNDTILRMSYTVPGGEKAEDAFREFIEVTGEMHAYLARVLEERGPASGDDLLTRLSRAEVDGEKLTVEEILGFFQLLLLAGSETTTNLINSAILCFIENPDQLARLEASPGLLPSAIEEVLRHRSPLQWMIRVTRRDVDLHGRLVPAGKVVLPVIGSANRDPAQFPEPGRFDIGRDPNPHIAFGHGIHFCLGAALSRLEARIALGDLLERVKGIELAGSDAWEPRPGLHVHGPARLPIRFRPGPQAQALAPHSRLPAGSTPQAGCGGGGGGPP